MVLSQLVTSYRVNVCPVGSWSRMTTYVGSNFIFQMNPSYSTVLGLAQSRNTPHLPRWHLSLTAKKWTIADTWRREFMVPLSPIPVQDASVTGSPMLLWPLPEGGLFPGLNGPGHSEGRACRSVASTRHALSRPGLEALLLLLGSAGRQIILVRLFACPETLSQ